MFPTVDATRCSGANQNFTDLLGTNEFLSSQNSPSSPFSTLQLITPQTSSTSSNSSLTRGISNLQTILQNLLAALQSIFSPAKDTPTPTSDILATSGTTSSAPFTQAPIEEPATIIPALNTPTGAQTVVNLEELEQAPTTVNTINQDSSFEDSVVQSSFKSASTKKTSGGKSKASSLRGNGEFLWKPVSDKDGKLAVLLPKHYTGEISSVKVLSPKDGSVLAKGKYSGVGNGDREHFRFSKAGGAFPDGSIVQVTLKNGQKLEVTIKDTAKRVTR